MSSIRSGKTRKDLESGATERRLANRSARVSWEKTSGKSLDFPSGVCGGKKNSTKKHNNKRGR